THAHRYTDTHTDTHRHTQTHTDTHRHTQPPQDTHTHTQTDDATRTQHRHTQTHTDTHRHTQTHTDTHLLRPPRAASSPQLSVRAQSGRCNYRQLWPLAPLAHHNRLELLACSKVSTSCHA